MRLSLDTREVGRVTIVRCNGRIVAGGESESLRAHVDWLLRDRRSIVLHMGEVGFIDSSGLGTMVRSLTSIRRAHGDLKLCNVTEPVRKVLEMSRLTQVFDAHESEEKAVAAFYRTGAPAGAPAEMPVPIGRGILCVDCNRDVLAYLRLLLNPRDDLSFQRVVNEPARGIGKTSLEHLRAYAEPRELSLLSAARDAAKVPAIKGRAAKTA